MAGTNFGRYKLVRLLARGGMAEVYLALLSGVAGFEKRIALKKILPIYTELEEFHRLFQDEARICVSLNHSNIVQVFDFGVHQTEYYLAMEYVDGPDLEKILMGARKLGRQLSVDSVVHMAIRVASALEYAHSRVDEEGRSLELVHRDVSPPNVLLSVQGEVKLTDFGVARYAQRVSQSRPGVVRGKYAYMSPEQLTGDVLDSRSDLFSLGVLLFEMLTNVNPFLGESDYKTMEKVVACRPGSVSDYRSGVPRDLVRIVERCLHVQPGSRYQSAGEVRRDLAELMFSRGVIDDRQLIVDELWALFPTQLSRRGLSVPRPREDVSGAMSVGMPRMRAGNRVGGGAEDWVGVESGAPTLLDHELEDDDPDDDLTIPHVVDNPDAIPTQPLDGLSHTLDVAPLAPASEATLREELENPFAVKGLKSRSSRPVRLERLPLERVGPERPNPGIHAALASPVEIEEVQASAKAMSPSEVLLRVPEPAGLAGAITSPASMETMGPSDEDGAEVAWAGGAPEPTDSGPSSPLDEDSLETRRVTSEGAQSQSAVASKQEAEAAIEDMGLRQADREEKDEESSLYGNAFRFVVALMLLWFVLNFFFGPENNRMVSERPPASDAAQMDHLSTEGQRATDSDSTSSVDTPALTGSPAAVEGATPAGSGVAPTSSREPQAEVPGSVPELPSLPVESGTPPEESGTPPETERPTSDANSASDGSREKPADSIVKMTIATSPSGADLTIDGTRVGPAPFEVQSSPGTVVEIVARKDGYLSATKVARFGVEASTTTVVLSSMQPRAETPKVRVTITSEPWAYVMVDGVATGEKTPLTVELESGSHRIVIESPLESWTEERTITLGEETEMTVRFTKP